jgi:NADH-quinone oxidoreductase subunit D
MNAVIEPPQKNYELLPKEGDGEFLEVAMGPHHPSTHGVFRMDVVLDGERVVKLKPVFGYLHRNHEKSPRAPAIFPRCPTRIGSIIFVR